LEVVLSFVNVKDHNLTLSHFDVFIEVLGCIACFPTDCKEAQTVATRDLQVFLFWKRERISLVD
jgi:hypothetical protein